MAVDFWTLPLNVLVIVSTAGGKTCVPEDLAGEAASTVPGHAVILNLFVEFFFARSSFKSAVSLKLKMRLDFNNIHKQNLRQRKFLITQVVYM